MMRAFTASWRRGVAIVVLLGFLPLSTACFGSFSLTHKVYHFNKSVSPDKWIRWLVFLTLAILPVYALASLVDVLFANSVEFWTGSNPITRLEPQKVVGPNGEVATLTPVPNGGRLVVTEPSGSVHGVTLLRAQPGVVAAYDDAGRLLGRVVGLGSDSPRVEGLATAG